MSSWRIDLSCFLQDDQRGRAFFMRSPLKSASFLAATILCIASLGVLAWIIIQSTSLHADFKAVPFLGLGALIANMWWRAWRYINVVQELLATEASRHLDTPNTNSIILQIMSRVVLDLLLLSFSAISLLAWMFAVVLYRIGGWPIR